jgi:hypothetical protein
MRIKGTRNALDANINILRQMIGRADGEELRTEMREALYRIDMLAEEVMNDFEELVNSFEDRRCELCGNRGDMLGEKRDRSTAKIGCRCPHVGVDCFTYEGRTRD